MRLSSTYRGVRELQGSYCVYILKNIGLLKKKKKKKKKKKTPRCPTISNKKTKTNKQRNDKKNSGTKVSRCMSFYSSVEAFGTEHSRRDFYNKLLYKATM